jgi:hypothetical protein
MSELDQSLSYPIRNGTAGLLVKLVACPSSQKGER